MTTATSHKWADDSPSEGEGESSDERVREKVPNVSAHHQGSDEGKPHRQGQVQVASAKIDEAQEGAKVKEIRHKLIEQWTTDGWTFCETAAALEQLTFIVKEPVEFLNWVLLPGLAGIFFVFLCVSCVFM